MKFNVFELFTFVLLGSLFSLALYDAKQGMDRVAANQKCQALGYSAGHYEREAGLVCEQWIEAAKVTP